MFSDTIDFLKIQDVEYTENEDYSCRSYIKAGGCAALSVAPDSIEKLVTVIRYLSSNGLQYKVVGRMSNSMLDDGLYQGVIIKTDKVARKSVAENTICAECGARLSRLIWDMARLGYGGAEELIMIPGSIGGALYNNAGAHGKTISDYIVSAYVYFLDSDEIRNLSPDELKLGYRKSIFKNNGAILLSCTLRLESSELAAIVERARNFAMARRAAQPLEYPSLGSVFIRCKDIGAGYYIEKAGLKGYRIGGAVISQKHAGFIINTGKATAQDIKELITYVKHAVATKFNVDLTEEIEIIH